MTCKQYYREQDVKITKKLNKKKNANLYTVMPKLRNLRCSENTITANIAPLTPEECSGQFDLYPCIPASILLHFMIGLAGQLLTQIVDMINVKHTVTSLRLNHADLPLPVIMLY